MDSNDQTEPEAPQAEPETDFKYPPYRSPLIVRGLIFLFFVLLVIAIYSGRLFEPVAPAHSFKSDLQKLGLAYHEFHRQRERSPSSLEDLQDFIANPPPPPKTDSIVPPDPVVELDFPDDLQKMIQEGALVVVWNAALTNSGQENDKYLLAYSKDIAEKGGFALTAAGRPRELTADEFKAYPLVTALADEAKQTEAEEAAAQANKAAEPAETEAKKSPDETQP